jgi:putative membrane protein
MFFMLFFWILVIICLSYLLKGFIPSILAEKNVKPGDSAAFDILCQRYAKGEINKVEFEMRKKDITG